MTDGYFSVREVVNDHRTDPVDLLDNLICAVAVRPVHVTPSVSLILLQWLSPQITTHPAELLVASYFSLANRAERQRSHGESRTESGADHRLLLRDRPEDGRDAGEG